MRTSRTAIETRRQCEHRRYWQFDAYGTGLEPIGASMSLIGGQSGHAMLAPIVMGGNVDQMIAEANAAYAAEVLGRGITGVHPDVLAFVVKEQQVLFEGLVRGWLKYRLPQILDEYEPVSAEAEWVVPLSQDFDQDFELPIRLDMLLRHRENGTLVILDPKFLGYVRDGWRESKFHNLQTLLYVEAAERHTGEYVEGIMYEALIKGKRMKGSKAGQFAEREIQHSPLCYGYKVESKDCLTYQSDYTARKGASQIAIWQEMDPHEWWQAYVSEEDYRGLYVSTGLISPPPEERRSAVAQVVRAEYAYDDATRHITTWNTRNGLSLAESVIAHLEPNTDHCYQYGTRHRCPFYEICFNPVVAADPLASGLFAPRVDHHEVAEVEEEAA